MAPFSSVGASAIPGALQALVLAILVRYLLHPLRRVSAEASFIDPAHPEMRLNEHGLPTEIAPLVSAFNLALGRLEIGLIAQRDFLANTAHELKTPLSLMRAQLEIDGMDAKDHLIRDVDHMSRQVQQLLLLAEVCEKQHFQFLRHDPTSTAHEAMHVLNPIAARKNVQLILVAPQSAFTIACDQGALFALMRNLVENAISVAPNGSQVTISISAQQISVSDQGPGIHADHMPHLFKRFWRAPDRTDDGAGLGLAICKEISAAHGWTLTASNLHDGGAEFQIHLH